MFQVRFVKFLGLIDILSLPIAENSRVPPLLDLSGITKLRDLELRCAVHTIQWINMSLSTVNSEFLQQITIIVTSYYTNFNHPVEESINQEWRDLDRLLMHLWASRSILPRIRYRDVIEEDKLGELLSGLLPKLASKGVVGVVEWHQIYPICCFPYEFPPALRV